ncbi:MAG TPA: LysR family transcriptional regulator [Phycisphaerales bacterium]|nr:LysR family transcriptional regulator [Phycisphaerales bacterium]HCD34069.1 LysR family transcriptional regulator [Phycisphaerales bacterium]
MIDVPTRLKELGWQLPPVVPPVAVYVPAVQTGDLLVVSGQLPMREGQLLATGPVPSVVSPDQAAEAAGQCAVNALAAVGAHLDGDWSRLVQVVRLGVFVLSDTGYGGQPTVANGASQLLGDLFGDAGRHARVAVGVNALPLNACVEVEMMVQIKS